MIYLLDVNALVALAVADHVFHDRVGAWIRRPGTESLATSPITELGFVRVLALAAAYGLNVSQARGLLHRLKRASGKFSFIPDAHGASDLPGWVKTPRQITDGHLSRLAAVNGAQLATLDENIPDSFLIPG
jgi:predicted nucleic acid-binding protein